MQNETNISKEMINSLFRMMKNGDSGKRSVKKILDESLSANQKEAVGKIMSDPQRLKEILSSPQAKELIEKFGNMNKGENKNGPA